MIRRRAKLPEEASFDLTPMVDVVLLLIIFFMLSSQFAQAQRRPVDLPAESGRPGTADGTDLIVVDIDGPGRYFVFGRPVNLEQLKKSLSAERTRRGDLAGKLDIVVRADKNSPAAELNRLAEMFASTGLRTWKLATRSPGGGAQ